MERPFVKYPLLLVALGVILRSVVHLLGLEHQGADLLTRFLALPLFLIAASFLSIWFERKKDSSFLDHFKNGLRGAMIYAVLLALFSGLYYGSISPEYFQKVHDQRKAKVEKLLEKAKNADSKEELDVDFPQGQGLEDLIGNLEARKANLKKSLSYTEPFWVVTLNLMVYTVIGILSTLVISLIVRYLSPQVSS